MTRRATEPKQDITLTGETNAQEFPARVYRSKGDEDNAKRVQATKEADYEKATLESEREAAKERKTAKTTLDGGTKVAGPSEVIDRLKSGGGRESRSESRSSDSK